MAKDLKFQGIMMIFGYIIVVCIIVHIVCCIYLREGLSSNQQAAIKPLKPTYRKCDDLYGRK